MVINLQKKVNKPTRNREGKSWISRLLTQPGEDQANQPLEQLGTPGARQA